MRFPRKRKREATQITKYGNFQQYLLVSSTVSLSLSLCLSVCLPDGDDIRCRRTHDKRKRERRGRRAREGTKCFASCNSIVGSQRIAGNTQRSETSGETDTRAAYAVRETNRTRPTRRAVDTWLDEEGIKRRSKRVEIRRSRAKLLRADVNTFMQTTSEYETICQRFNESSSWYFPSLPPTMPLCSYSVYGVLVILIIRHFPLDIFKAVNCANIDRELSRNHALTRATSTIIIIYREVFC